MPADANSPIMIDVNGAPIAVRHIAGKEPGIMWLGGYRSDMAGTKAVELEAMARENGHASIRFDYSGHGESGGEFLDGCISVWLREAMAVFERFAGAKTVLVGSSMGGWVALRMAQELARRGESGRLAGIVLIAPAPDFPLELMAPQLTQAQWDEMDAKGYFEVPTQYGPEPNRFTKLLFDDTKNNRIMTGNVETFCKVHILQGQEDPDVPWQHAQRLYEMIAKDDVSLTYIKDGDHRLSRPEDIGIIKAITADMMGLDGSKYRI